MVNAVNHDTASSLATAGWESGKGALSWVMKAPTWAAIIVGGVTALSGGTLGLALGLAGAAGAAILGAEALLAPVTGAVAAAGALSGLAKGGKRVGEEKAAYLNKHQHHAESRHQKTERIKTDAWEAGLNQGMDEGKQIGIQLGRQEGFNHAVDLMRQQEELAKQQGGQKAEILKHPSVDNKAVVGPATAQEVAKRAAAAAAKTGEMKK